ncbi:macro domain-containing protein [Streptomyces sp. NPDC093094]|uniref:macro domain-containing protein n=1 Tax=Streptomyces sp. NPDC093094 TaxID=3366026 RepID=UPI00381DEC70
MAASGLPDHAAILRELREVRRAGIIRLRELEPPRLADAAQTLESKEPGTSVAVEQLLRAAVFTLESGSLRDAAAYSLGLAPGSRDWSAADRRKRAALVYGVSVERFRKHHEMMVLGQVSERILDLLAGAPEAVAAPVAPDAGVLAPTHRPLLVAAGSRTVRVLLHVHPVDLLRDIDVVVSPANTHLALSPSYKSSVSASLRRAGASHDPTGALLHDHVHDELRTWHTRHDHRVVRPGSVVPTSAGELSRQGVRRMYHAVVAVPRSGTNDYDVLPADVTRATARVFALLAEEERCFDPPLRSVCLPLLGAGRGGLRPEESLAALWAAVEAELARGASWEVHLVVRRPTVAALVQRMLAVRSSDRAEAGR